jgi:hypothetical protein
MIGGATRNVGKTSLSCKIIERFAETNKIIGLKIKTLYEGDSFFHGKERNPLTGEFRITEEKDIKGTEDTSKMLRVGAKRVFRIKVKSNSIEKAFNELEKITGQNCVFVCESNSLRKAVRPGIFIMIKNKDSETMKPSAKELQKFADRIVYSDGKKHNFDAGKLMIKNGEWKFL